VFARAKESAKKAAAISNLKQMGTSLNIYLTDSDDMFPLGYRYTPGTPDGTWRFNFTVSTPLGWMGPGLVQGTPARMAEDQSHWSNTINPYTKNYGVYEGPGMPTRDVYGPIPAGQIKAPALVNITYNGLLHAYNATAVAQPSRIPLLWNGRGKGNALGASLSNPSLNCPNPGDCRYNAGASPQAAAVYPGGWMYVIYETIWMWANGGNFTMTDTSTKFRRLGAAISPANTDPLTDPYTGYNAQGNPGFFWCNTGPCYPYLFRPDYEPIN
jgi:hypothetical protein